MQQMLVDPEEHNDWVAEFKVDLTRSHEAAEPVLRLVRLESLTYATFHRAPCACRPWLAGGALGALWGHPGEGPRKSG
jgi:hypothetical protein